MYKIVLVTLAFAAFSAKAQAQQVPDPGAYSPGYTSQPGAPVAPPGGPFRPTHASGMDNNHRGGILGIFRRSGQTLPVYQAAPWYNYWPYDAHFLTPAPMTGAYYAPPMGGYSIQPFFPQTSYGYAPPYGPGTGFGPQNYVPMGQPPLLNPPAMR